MKKLILPFIFLFSLSVLAEEAVESPADEPAKEESAKEESAKEEPAPSKTETVAPSTQSSSVLGIQFGQMRSNSSVQGQNEKTTFSGGASLEYLLVENWFLQAELNYLNKGWDLVGTLAGDNISLKYFEFPLFLKKKFPWANVSPSLFAGPWIAYLHSSTTTLLSVNIDTTSSTRRFEYGIYVGAGIDFALSESVELGVASRYGWGLSDLNEESGSEKVYNRAFLWSASVKFRL